MKDAINLHYMKCWSGYLSLCCFTYDHSFYASALAMAVAGGIMFLDVLMNAISQERLGGISSNLAQTLQLRDELIRF